MPSGSGGPGPGAPGPGGPGAGSTPTATPYTGPVFDTAAERSVVAGSTARFTGSNLTGITKVSVNGSDLDFEISEDGELVLTLPSDLASGTYNLNVTSDSGNLTVQSALKVIGKIDVEVRPSTKKQLDSTVKIRVFNVVDAGKVQVFVNGKEIAWVRATAESDSKLTKGYLVRTIVLVSGKNAIETYVDGVRIDRKAYSK